MAAGIVTEEQVSIALERQRDSGRRLGEELVAQGFASEVQLTQMLSNQLTVPWVTLQRIEFTRELLSLMPAEMANRLCAIPIYVRRLRSAVTVYVAMDDPTNERALNEVRTTLQMPVKAMVAPPSEIRHAIRVYYFGAAPQQPIPNRKASRHPEATEAAVSAAAAKIPQAAVPSGGQDSAPAPSAPDASSAPDAPSAPDAQAEATTAVEDSAATEQASAAQGDPQDAQAAAAPAASPEPPAAEPQPPTKKRKKKQRFVTLTLLDGTTVRLPAPGGEPEEEEKPAALTASDLVAALLARAQGADVSDVLPDEHWEVLFATLLTLLIKKGLIADWEFVEEWKNRQGS